MKLSLEHKYLIVDFSSDEHAKAVLGDVHDKRTKIDLSIVGSVNHDALNELAGALGPIAARFVNTPPPDLQRPRIVDCESELYDDLRDLAEAAAHDLGMKHGEFLAMVMNACGEAWPLQPTDHGTYTRSGDPDANQPSPA